MGIGRCRVPALLVKPNPSFVMKIFRRLRSPFNRRSTLRDLHAFGIVSVFRRPSIFRIWEPLREQPRHSEDLAG